MTGIYSRRRLEVQGVSMSSLKNHPPAEDEFENPHSVYSTTGSRRVSIASETLSCSTNCSSLSSVDDDDFEKESAQTIQHLFDDIDSVLYDDTLIASNNNLMSEECKDWIDQYPHFRIIGKQIIPEEDIGFEIVNVKSESSTPASSLNEEVAEENVKLSVQGKQMDIYIPPLTNVNKDQSEEFGLKSQEEIILQDGEYEELIAVDHGHNKYEQGIKTTYHNLSANEIMPFKENLLDLLEDKIWSEVVSWMRPLIREYVTHVHSRSLNVSSRTAPPALPTSVSSRNMIGEQMNMRLATAPPRSSMRNDFNGLLTVSSKMLQYRSEKLNSSLPNNPLGLARKNALKYISGENSSSVVNASRLIPSRRIPTAVRLTPLDHSLKKPLNEIKDESWEKKQVSPRPLTAKKPSPVGRVSSSYWNRNITLPPIQQSESGSIDLTKSMINKTSKYKNDRLRKLSLQSPELHNNQHVKKENTTVKTFSKTSDFDKEEKTYTVDDATTSGLNSFAMLSNSSESSHTEDSQSSSLNSQWELVQTKEMDALNEDSVHTVEPFVTWLLTQVQSNACKAADAVEDNRTSS